MSLVRWEPFRDLLALQARINRTLDPAASASEEQLGTWAPAVDIHETEKEIVLKADLPGINLDDVDIRVENNVLTLRGERRFEKEVKDENYHRVERSYGSFVRTFSLPNSVNSEQIEAGYDNGVLKVVMPKREEARPKQIKVNVKKAA